MSRTRGAQLRRLMTWFPSAWRAEWEDVVVGSLEDDADRRSLDTIPQLEAWGLRAHGLVERLAEARASLVTAALVAAVVGAASVFLIDPAPQVAAVLPVLSTLIGPLLLAAVIAGLAYRAGLLTVRGVGAALTIGAVALTGAYLARLSWSVGFDEADAGRPTSWSAAAFVPLFVASWLLGAAAFLPLLLGTFRDVRPRPLRFAGAAVVAAAAAIAVGIGLIWPTSCALVAAPLTVITLRQRPRPDAASRPTSTPGGPPVRRWRKPLRLGLAAFTLIVSSLAVAFALTGDAWPGYSGDGTNAMNLGLGAACLSSVPVLLLAGDSLRALPRYRPTPAPAFAVTAAVLAAASQWTGAGNDWQWPLLLIAAGFTGLTVGAFTIPALPVQGFPRIALVIALSAAAAGTIGVPAVSVGPMAVPLIALYLIVRTLRTPRQPVAGATSPPLSTA